MHFRVQISEKKLTNPILFKKYNPKPCIIHGKPAPRNIL